MRHVRARSIRRSFVAHGAWILLAVSCARARPRGLDDQAFESPNLAALAQAARDRPSAEPLRVDWSTTALASTDAGAEAWVARWSPMLRGVPRPLLAAYVAANRVPARETLPAAVGGHPVTVIAPASPGGADEDRYTLTMPGISVRGDSALVFVSRTCGPLCGRTDALVLVHDAGGWRVASCPFSASH